MSTAQSGRLNARPLRKNVTDYLLLDFGTSKSYITIMNNQNSLFEIEGSIFKFLSSLFTRNKVRCVLVGGYALIVNKVQRMTFDIDFIVTAVDCSRIEPDIIKAGYSIFNRKCPGCVNK